MFWKLPQIPGSLLLFLILSSSQRELVLDPQLWSAQVTMSGLLETFPSPSPVFLHRLLDSWAITRKPFAALQWQVIFQYPKNIMHEKVGYTEVFFCLKCHSSVARYKAQRLASSSQQWTEFSLETDWKKPYPSQSLFTLTGEQKARGVKRPENKVATSLLLQRVL